MDLNGSSVPATPTHWDPVTRNDRVSATINQPSTAGDTSILRSVEINGSETKCDTAPPDGDDDDVQILFSVPRRRRKKRKSFDRDSLRSTAVLNHQFRHHEKNLFPSSRLEPFHQTQRSVALSEPLHSYQYPQRRHPDGTHFSTTDPSMFRSNHDYQLPPVYYSPYGGSQLSEVSSLPTPWWEPAPARTLSTPVHNVDYRSHQSEDGTGSKRRHYGDWEMPSRYHRQSMQISPRTNPTAGFDSQMSSPYGMTYNTQDMYERPLNGPPAQTRWPSFDLNAFNEANTNNFISQSLQQAAILTKPPTPEKIFASTTDQHQREISEHPASQVPLNVVHQSGCPLAHEKASDRNSLLSLPMIEPPRNVAIPATQPHLTYVSQSIPNGVSSLVAQPQDNTQSLKRTATQAIVPEQSATMVKPASTAISRLPDAVRRPSLYKIPLWPPSSGVVGLESIGSQNKSSQLPDTTSNGVSHTLEQTAPSVSTQVDVTSKANEQRQAAKDDATPANPGQFEVPKPKAGRKHSPNLIVDIAETCQEFFPFAAVAERHKVPLKKVFDTFAAIIQLPLLRNADDRRRHGSLGKQRVKEYRDAKKAQERAKEAERKSQMKIMRARIEEAGKKGKEGAGAVADAGAMSSEVSQPNVVGNAMAADEGAVVLRTATGVDGASVVTAATGIAGGV